MEHVRVFVRVKNNKRGDVDELEEDELQFALEKYEYNNLITMVPRKVYSVEMIPDIACDAQRVLHNRYRTKSLGLLQIQFDRGMGKQYFKPTKKQKSSDGTHNNGLREVFQMEGEHPNVSGLFIFNDFISVEEEEALLKQLSKSDMWQSPPVVGNPRQQPTHRRVRHFGFEFNYVTKRCDPTQPLEPFPNWIQSSVKGRNIVSLIIDRVNDVLKQSPNHPSPWCTDQLTINEYLPGQGISPHVDTHSAFFDGIASLSLGSATTMIFAHHGVKTQPEDVLLNPRSLAIFSGLSRYAYTHGIPQRHCDLIAKAGIMRRGTRYSMTFRHIRRTPNQVCSQCICPELCDLQTHE